MNSAHRSQLLAVPLDLAALGGRQFAVQVGRDPVEHLAAVGVWRRLHASSSCSRRNTRARCSRVFTFASENPVTFATSRVDSPSISRRNTITR